MEHEDAAAIFSGIRTFLYKEKTGMTEQFSVHPDNSDGLSELHNFKKGFNGMPDGVPAAYAQACFDYEKKQRKDDSTFNIGSKLLQMDSSGGMQVQDASNHIYFYPAELAALRDALNALVTPDPVGEADNHDVFQQMPKDQFAVINRAEYKSSGVPGTEA